MESQSITTVMRRILIEDLGVAAEVISKSGSNTPLLGRGIGIDSMETLTLTVGLEEAFNIQINDEELNEALFETLGSLERFVAGKINASKNAS